MSRRERISDFTRPVLRNRVSDLRRVDPVSQPRQVVEPATPAKPKTRSKIQRNQPNRPPAEPRQDRSKVLRRQGLKKLPPFTPKKQKKHVNIKLILSGMAVFVIILVAPFLFYMSIVQNKGFVLGIKKAIITDDTPKYLTSSSIMDVAARVDVIKGVEINNPQPFGLNNIGWFSESAKPGQPGVAVFTGYVSGSDSTGALRDIRAIKIGDTIKIETGDGKVVPYKVESVQKKTPEEIDFNELKRPISEGKNGLSIVTIKDTVSPGSELGMFRYVVRAVEELN